MKKALLATALYAASMALTACGTTDSGGPRPLTPVPSHVPAKPQYETADDVVTAMARGGIECEVLRRREGNANAGSGLDCVAEIDGAKVENDVHVLNPKVFSRDEVGDSIAAGRKAPYNHTIVAAGNWFIRVLNPDYAPQVAKALKGVVLKPLNATRSPTPGSPSQGLK